MFSWNYFQVRVKILGCKDPRYKHENSSITIYQYELHKSLLICFLSYKTLYEVTWSYKTLYEVTWSYMKLLEVTWSYMKSYMKLHEELYEVTEEKI